MVLSFLSRLHPYTASRSPSRLPSGSLLDTIKSLSRFETIPIAGGSQSQHQPRTHWEFIPLGVNSCLHPWRVSHALPNQPTQHPQSGVLYL